VDWQHLSHQLEDVSLEELVLDDIKTFNPDNSGSLFRLLRRAKSLHTFTMIDMDIPSATDAHVVSVLGGLRRLRLAWRTPNHLHSVAGAFTSLETPSLDELILADLTDSVVTNSDENCQDADLDTKTQGHSIVSACADIQPLLDAMSAWSQSVTITKLHINGVRMNPDLSESSPVDQFRALFSINAFRNVESLFLRDTDKYIIESLFLGRDANECMPSLRTVYLDQRAGEACQEFIYISTGLRISLQDTVLSLGSDKPMRFRGVFGV
jgi:hypothetical protein